MFMCLHANYDKFYFVVFILQIPIFVSSSFQPSEALIKRKGSCCRNGYSFHFSDFEMSLSPCVT